MAKKGKKSRKRKSCKCYDMQSCTAYLRRAYRTSRKSKARAAARRAPVSSMTYPTGVRTTEGW